MDDRRDDWRRGVDENLASVNEGRRVTEREIGRLWKAYSDDDKLLRGDKDKDTDGLISRLHRAENEINLLNALVRKDAAGGKGLIGRMEALENKDKHTIEVWKFWVALIGALAAILVALITNLDKIESFLNRKERGDPVHEAIERAKRPRGKKVYRVRVIPAEDGEDGQDEPNKAP